MTAPASSSLCIVAPRCGRDACFSLPAARALAATRSVTLLCPSEQSFLWSEAGMDEVIAYPHPPGKKETLEFFRAIPEVLLWEAGPLADAAAKAGVPVRVGLPAQGLEKRLTRTLEVASPPGPTTHAVTRFLKVAEALEADPFNRRFFEPLAADDPKEDTLLLGPESPFGPHFEWPLERWSALLESLTAVKGKLRVLASQARWVNWAAQHELPVLEPPTWGEALSRTARVISVDSASPHYAAAFGAECAVLYGPGDPALHRPLGKQHLAIRHKAECSPCFAAKCLVDLRCQQDLEVAEVAEALQAFVIS